MQLTCTNKKNSKMKPKQARRLDDMPAEILWNVVEQLESDEFERAAIAAFSRVSKRIRAVTLPAIFNRITSNSEARRTGPSGPQYISSLPGLLRTVVTNPDIAAMIDEVDLTWWYDLMPIIFPADIAAFQKAAARFGLLVPPGLRCSVDATTRNSSHVGGTNRLRDPVGGWKELNPEPDYYWLAEMLLLHTPNVRKLNYRLVHRGYRATESSALKVLDTASQSGILARPLFPKLEHARFNDLDGLQRLRSLGVWAPNLLALHLERHKNQQGAQIHLSCPLRHVTDLVLGDVLIGGSQCKVLISAFPALKRFHYRSAEPDVVDGVRDPICSPQQVIDALKPVQGRLTRLELFAGKWHLYGSHTDPMIIELEDQTNQQIRTGIITDLTGFGALEHLVVDGNSLREGLAEGEFVHNSADQPADSVICQGKLPATLKTLSLTDLEHLLFLRDLEMFDAKNCCPELETITVDYIGPEMLAKKAWNKRMSSLTTHFAEEHGVRFERVNGDYVSCVFYNYSMGNKCNCTGVWRNGPWHGYQYELEHDLSRRSDVEKREGLLANFCR